MTTPDELGEAISQLTNRLDDLARQGRAFWAFADRITDLVAALPPSYQRPFIDELSALLKETGPIE